ncbi:hypothetical protein [Enterobacteria phage vB_EcoM_IME540]|nr:hypothetical protein [Enterobacteria phage vB_EcoM_IME540]
MVKNKFGKGCFTRTGRAIQCNPFALTSFNGFNDFFKSRPLADIQVFKCNHANFTRLTYKVSKTNLSSRARSSVGYTVLVSRLSNHHFLGVYTVSMRPLLKYSFVVYEYPAHSKSAAAFVEYKVTFPSYSNGISYPSLSL